MKKSRIILLSLQLLAFVAPLAAHAEDLDLINRPVNTSGLTGLLVTTSLFTLTKRSIEISAVCCQKTACFQNTHPFPIR